MDKKHAVMIGTLIAICCIAELVNKIIDKLKGKREGHE